MRKDILTIGVSLLILGITVASAPLIIGRAIEIDETLVVEPFYRRAIVLTLKSGDMIEGYFTVRGGANDDVIFFIEDPRGNVIHSPADRVYRYYEFKFTANMDGTHLLWYDNTFSIISSKYVYLTVRINPFGRLMWATYLGVMLIVAGVIACTVGVVKSQR